MKRCPECRRDYYDDTLLYCLDDGSGLLEGPGLSEPPASAGGSTVRTADLSEPPASAGGLSATAREQTGPGTAILSLPSDAEPATRIYSRETAEPHHTSTRLETKPGLSMNRAAKPLALVAAGILVLAAGLFGYRYLNTNPKQINSIAVLPFENRGSDADSEYLSDGLAESLIYRLSQIPDLKVSPRTSVFRYKGKDADAETVGSDLGVDAVMSGRLVRRGDNLSISVDLVDVRNKKTLWGEQFERKMSDLLATQREIASAITDKLQLRLTGADATGITKRYTQSNDAYQHYLQGRFYWNKRTPDSMQKAIEQFNEAVKADPEFALAYSGLADVYVVEQYFTRRWQGDYGLGTAGDNARRAIELDPTIAEPHATLGLVYEFQWRWDDAERELRRAIELDPKYATAHHWLSRFLRIRGRYDEAFVEIKKAQDADPLSLIIAENVVQNLLEKGDLDGAVQQCQRSIDLDPQFWAIRFRYAAALLEKGEKEEGLAEARHSFELINQGTIAMGFLGYAQAVAGHRDEAIATARELEKRSAAGECDGVRVASVYIGLGDRDKVYEWLEKDFAAKRPSMVEIFQEREFWQLRNEPRFLDLKHRMGLPA